MSRDDIRGKPVALIAGVPLHRQLFLVLHDEIARGAIPAGDPLPTEQELCDQFGVSRITVRRALADLADQGFITRRQGVGSFVRQDSATARQFDSRSYRRVSLARCGLALSDAHSGAVRELGLDQLDVVLGLQIGIGQELDRPRVLTDVAELGDGRAGVRSGTQAAFWSSAMAPTGPLPNVVSELT